MGVLWVPCGAAGALAGVLEIFWFRRPVEWVRAVLPRGSCLFGRGLVDHFLWVCWGPVGPCVAADALVVLLGAYRGAGVGAIAPVSGCRGHFRIFCSEVWERFN